MKDKIKEFLESNETELSLPFIPLEIYEALFIELGGKTKETDEIMTLLYKNGNVSNKVNNNLNFILKQIL